MDWTGNKNSIFKTLGASNHTDKERQAEDYYATDPIAAKLLLGVEHFEGPVWECACGQGHLAEVFRQAGIPTRASDIIDRGYGEVFDFLSMENQSWDGDIITNPPYKWALDFIYKALTIIPDGRKVAMFLKVQFLEGKERRALYRSTPPNRSMSRPAGFSARRTGVSTRCAPQEALPWRMRGLSGRRATRARPS